MKNQSKSTGFCIGACLVFCFELAGFSEKCSAIEQRPKCACVYSFKSFILMSVFTTNKRENSGNFHYISMYIKSESLEPPVVHGAATTSLPHQILSCANYCASLHVNLNSFKSISAVFIHVVFGQLRFLFPCGVQLRATLVFGLVSSVEHDLTV